MEDNSYDLVQSVNVSRSWGQNPFPDNASFAVQRVVDENRHYVKFIIAIINNPTGDSLAYDILKATLNFYINRCGNPFYNPVEIRVANDENTTTTIFAIENELVNNRIKWKVERTKSNPLYIQFTWTKVEES